ncbi:MAG: tRNA (uridine(54)-C5)-methyltransferase TrmA [Alteromonadaceae bacterium TMED7]|nr:tRNA (uridine(54)-C5)-methyltransferase TrmA [Alteromonadaceae bacterium]MCP4866664.1 tRNA (uridine(54)-C5)-methyltransferase TrmA [Alteromonas sp.]RPH12897.1 MAG: tRNA (uridine(54)-C5)-methyltransferase TrmA [Alteromonadaceae bacterium TMED7]|tara:strand:- start:12660 stop:13760 length:1101 start_codon:yes stop_codon:yes gene_type:complete
MSTAPTTTITYQDQLQAKVDTLTSLLSPFYQQALDVYPSPEQHYRMRAEFRVWHDDDDLYYIMFNKETKTPYQVDEFPAASETINRLMQRIIELVKPNPVLRKKLFQVDFLSGLSQECVISLLYHRQLDNEWQVQAEALRTELNKKFKVSVIGRARKQKVILGDDFIIEELPADGKTYQFKHIENSFTQPNAYVNTHMIEWAIAQSQGLTGDLLELYCGAGNFSIPLAAHFDHVVGTEIAKPSVEAAQFNIAVNKIDNVQIARLSAEEFVEALAGKRQFERLKGIELTERQFNTVLVDPPRAGLDPATTQMISQFDNIIYISCNPHTLVENLEALSSTHEVSRAALFDQFPFTEHMESGVLLTRKA